MKEKIENFNVEFDATLVDIMGLLYFGSMTIKEWAEDLAIEIREDMDFRSLREKECEISRKTFVVENNLFLAKSAVRVAEASKARSYGASYSEIANQASAGRRKTAASIESEVEAKIEAASDRLIYSQILLNFWETQRTILASKREILKNIFWISKEEMDRSNRMETVGNA